MRSVDEAQAEIGQKSPNGAKLKIQEKRSTRNRWRGVQWEGGIYLEEGHTFDRTVRRTKWAEMQMWA